MQSFCRALQQIRNRGIHPHRAAIEAALIERERSLFNLDTTIYLYDLTSTYFEGVCALGSGRLDLFRLDCPSRMLSYISESPHLPPFRNLAKFGVHQSAREEISNLVRKTGITCVGLGADWIEIPLDRATQGITEQRLHMGDSASTAA